MRHRRLTFLATVFAVAACTSRDSGTAGSRSRGAVADSSKSVSTVSWFDGAAPLLLAPAHSNDRALVVGADSLAPDLEEGVLQQPGTLIRLDGSVSSVRVSISSGSE